MARRGSYLSVCAIYRDEGPYLEEWIEFHRLVGVERFFLYNNSSIDDHARILQPFVEEGTVVMHDWPVFPGQKPAYEHCLRNYRTESRWVAFIDLDEFLFSPTGRSVSELLVDYEAWPAVVVNWATFGTSGHERKPDGLVIESYLHRSRHHDDNKWFKSIVNPQLTEGTRSMHAFRYREGMPVDENRRPVKAPPYGFSRSVSFSKLRINHYRTKSEEEYRKRMQLPWPYRNARPRPYLPGWERLNAEQDESILSYVPALRQALERRGSKVPQG